SKSWRCWIRKRAATLPPRSARYWSRCCTSCASVSSRRRAAESELLSLKVTVLGSGTSTGVPAIGCDCAVCRSTDPHDRRLRPSIVLEAEQGPVILVDTSTDLREQALANDLRRVDAILFTHTHADHVFGLDDVRRYNHMQRAAIPCYADAGTIASLRRMFSYVFEPPKQIGGGIPQLTLTEITGPFTIGS